MYVFYFIFYNKIDFQNYLETLHSIEVTVQDTKRIVSLSSAITEKTELQNGLISICGHYIVIQGGHHEDNNFFGDIF